MDNIAALKNSVSFGDSDISLDAEITAFNEALAKAEHDFREAMDDDFNTALAVASLFDLAREANAFGKKMDTYAGRKLPLPLKDVLEKAQGSFIRLGQVLGLFETGSAGGRNESDLADKLMNLIIDIRQEARSRKDWAMADAIRDKLKETGIILEDTPQGVRWKLK